MKLSFQNFISSLSGFTARHETFIFTTLARILAIACIAVASYFAYKLYGQINM